MKPTHDQIVEALFANNFNTNETAASLGFNTARNSDNFRKYCNKQFNQSIDDIKKHARNFSDSVRVPVATPAQEALLMKKSEQYGFNSDDIRMAWIKDDEVSVMVKPTEMPSYFSIREETIREYRAAAPRYEPIQYDTTGEHLMIVNPADVHIGKLSEAIQTGHSYDIEIAVKRVKEAVTINAVRCSLFGVKQILLVMGNDILHIDNPNRTTTGGTPQDTVGMWHSSWQIAKQLYIEIIEQLALIAPVTCVYCPSNHDKTHGYFLVDSVAERFHFHNGVTFQGNEVSFGKDGRLKTVATRKYVVFGRTLIVFDHGDHVKDEKLFPTIIDEARECISQITHIIVYRHHVHHKDVKYLGTVKIQKEKDYPGFTVINTGRLIDMRQNMRIEYMRSPSAPDGWHAENGYSNLMAIETFLLHPELGQIGSFMQPFR